MSPILYGLILVVVGTVLSGFTTMGALLLGIRIQTQLAARSALKAAKQTAPASNSIGIKVG
jgi:hypothetical protein